MVGRLDQLDEPVDANADDPRERWRLQSPTRPVDPEHRGRLWERLRRFGPVEKSYVPVDDDGQPAADGKGVTFGAIIEVLRAIDTLQGRHSSVLLSGGKIAALAGIKLRTMWRSINVAEKVLFLLEVDRPNGSRKPAYYSVAIGAIEDLAEDLAQAGGTTVAGPAAIGGTTAAAESSSGVVPPVPRAVVPPVPPAAPTPLTRARALSIPSKPAESRPPKGRDLSPGSPRKQLSCTPRDPWYRQFEGSVEAYLSHVAECIRERRSPLPPLTVAQQEAAMRAFPERGYLWRPARLKSPEGSDA